MFRFIHTTQSINTDETMIDELLHRGVDEVIHKESLKKKLLSGKQLRIKLGIDPTSPHLHIGRAVPLLKLRDFQKLGHTIVLIIGNGTGVVGDTSDKESERPMLTEKDITKNMETYFEQAGKILDMKCVEKRKNAEWLHTLTYKEIGEHANQFSVADFAARDNIKKRLDAGKRVSLREMLYPLMQGYDSVAIQADVELGGTDQRFNLLAGRVLQEHFGQSKQDILMTPLIDGTDGRKMSSSWGNTVRITATPDDMYAKIMSIDDALMPIYFETLTRIPMQEVKDIIEQLQSKTAHPRDHKMHLAHAITASFHNEQQADEAQKHFIDTFQKKEIPTHIPKISGTGALYGVLKEASLVTSKTDFKRLIDAGAIINQTTNHKIEEYDGFAQAGVYKIGKHRFIEITAV